MAYAAWSVIAGEQPTTSKWNILGSNDAAFNSGGGVLSTGLTLSHAVDANGWSKYDYNTFQTYKKRVTFSQTISSGASLTLSSTNLPAAIGSIGTNYLEYSFTATANAFSLSIVFEGSSAATSLGFTTCSNDLVSRSYTGWIDISITTP